MKPWYKEGLRFKCTGCGQCCTGAPGYVFVSDEEAIAIAKRLNISLTQFIAEYARRINGRLALKERLVNKNYDCVFLDGKRCTIYEDRPKQCRTYPWWQENVDSKKSWEEEALRCEGINHKDSPLISLQEIQKHLTE